MIEYSFNFKNNIWQNLVVFSGEAFTQCPLTTDHAIVESFLAGIQAGMLEDGTAIGMGLATAVNRLKDSESKEKVVILLTDGVNNSGYIQPLTASQIAKEFGVKVYTIGVGSRGDALTPVRRRSDGSYMYGKMPVKIDEELLQQIAQETGGAYYRATNEGVLQTIYEEIDQLEKTEIEVTTLKRYKEKFRSFALIVLILICLEFLLRYSVFRSLP